MSSNTQRSSRDITFEAQGGLFGGSGEGIFWDAFLGVGGEERIKAPVNLGGTVDMWLPFKGDTEILRLQLLGEIATRIGLALDLEISPGTTTATLPYNISFDYPDAETLAANPFFRLEGDGYYKEGPDAGSGFETDWPYFLFSIDAIFELAVLMDLYAGVFGNNGKLSLLNFDVTAEIPIVDIDTRPDNTPELFGIDFGEIASLNLTYEDESFEGLPTSFTAEFSGDDIDLLVGTAEDEDEDRKAAAEAARTEESKGAKDDDSTDDGKTDVKDKKSNSLLDELEIGQGPLATLTLNIPNIELADRGEGVNPGTGQIVDQKLGLFDEVSYKDGTREGDFDGTYDDPDFPTLVQDLAELNIDLDNIAVEAIKRALTGGVGVPNTPGLEGSFNLPFDFGIFEAGAYFNYNLIDTDLVFSLPINQTVEVTPDPLQTSLTFYAADENGVAIETDGMMSSTYVTARLPRYSVYFNESNTFWDPRVAAAIREAMQTNPAAAEDVALFVDFESGRIPGAFTGESDSIAGGVERRTGNGAWEKLTTNAEETEWLARSEVTTGADPQLDDLVARGNAEFRYVIYGPAGTVLDTIPLTFSDLVAEDGIFEARLDVVNAPLYSTGLLDGVPSFDIFYPGSPGESVWVEVAHRAAANVSNDTSLDFELELVMSALELGLGAYIKAFGARLGLDFSFGPVWEKTIPLVATELAKLYDDDFEISDTTFDSGDLTDQESWGFAIGAGGEAPVYADVGTAEDDLFDASVSDDNIDGMGGTDTLSFAKIAEGESVSFDLDAADNIVTEPVVTFEPVTEDGPSYFLRTAPYFNVGSMDLTGRFEVTRTGGLDDKVRLGISMQSVEPVAGGYSVFLSDQFSLAEGETGYVWFEIRPRDGDPTANPITSLFVSTTPVKPATPTYQSGVYPNDPTSKMVFSIFNSANFSDAAAQEIGKSYEFRNFTLSHADGTAIDFNQIINDKPSGLTNGTLVEDQISSGVTNVENLVGSRGDDDLKGDENDNRIEGGEGNDTLDGRDGADTLVGGLGEDVLITGGTSEGRDAAFGGEGNDRLVAGAGAALLDGGEDAPVGTSGGSPADLDIVDYREAPAAIAINLETGETSGPWVADHELRNIEGIASTGFDDTLTGDRGRSYFEAGDGEDLLRGDDIGEGLSRAELVALKGGNDRLYGQDGNDTLLADPGADFLDGGDGIDLVDYSDAPTSVFVDFNAGFTIDDAEFTPLLEGTGSDPIDFRRVDGQAWRGWAQGDKFRDVEDLTGSDYEDILFGDSDANVIRGGDGNDRIAGRNGLDTLLGGEGDDVFWTAAQQEFARDRSVDGNNAGTGRLPNNFSSISQTLDLRFADPDLAIDVIDGEGGNDLALLDWSGAVTIDEDNIRYISNYTNTTNTTRFFAINHPFGINRVSSITQTSSTNNYELDMRYEIKDLVQAVGDLETGIAALEFTPDKVSFTDDVRIVALRTNGDWYDLAPTTIDQFDQSYYTRTYETFRVYSNANDSSVVTRGDDYRDLQYKVTGLLLPEAGTFEFASLSNLSGLIGSEGTDILLGTDEANSLLGAGGADIIAAKGGDDVVRFGEGQSPETLFSFPGRALADISPFSDPGTGPGRDGEPGGSWASDYTSDAIDQDTFADIPPLNPGPGTFVGEGNLTLAPGTFYETHIDAYLAADVFDRAALEALQLAMIADRSQDNNETDSDAFARFAFVDGGEDMDTLDLRFDRGLGFLPDSGAEAANIYLNQYFGRLGDQNAVLLNIENVIGTAQDDRIYGDLGDNVLEGAAGADRLDASGGDDTVSYANAGAGINLFLEASSAYETSNRSTAVFASGDAEGDVVYGFEQLNGSEFGDRIGYTRVDTVNSGTSWISNAFDLFHAGKGDDLLIAGRHDAIFAGGEGDDRVIIPDILSDGDKLFVGGGDGVDRIDLGSKTVASFITDDGFDRAGLETADGLDISLVDIEYISAANGTFALDNADPTSGGGGSIALAEDGWSERVLFDANDFGSPSQGGTVTGLPETGAFFLETDAGRVPVALDQELTADDIKTLVFVPNQNFGVLSSEEGQQRAGAILELTFIADNGSVQTRDLAVTPGDFDGQSLGLTTPTDTEHTDQSFSVGELAVADGITSAEVALRGLGQVPNGALIEQNEAIALAMNEQSVATVQVQNAQALNSAWQAQYQSILAAYNAGGASLAQLNFAQAQLEASQQALQSARDGLTQANQQRTLAEIARDDAAKLLDFGINAAFVETRLGDAQAYRVTDIPDGGKLWLTETTPPEGASDLDAYGVARVLQEGDVIARSDFDNLAFGKSFGLINEEDTISLAPMERLQIEITETPEDGFIFSPVSALNLTLPGVDDAVKLIAPPSDGTLFYRDDDGARVEVGTGDILSRDLVSRLLFEADIDRRSTLSDAAAVDVDFDELNRPTLADGEPGEGATQVPTDPTAVSLVFKTETPAPEITGVTVDLASVGVTFAKPITDMPPQYDPPDPGAPGVPGIPPYGLDAPVDWVQWQVEDGGNGHFYAFAQLEGSSNSSRINPIVSGWNWDARGGDTALNSENLVTLASIADADENAFIYNLFGQDDSAWRGIYGPLFGGIRSAEGWAWTDGSDWTSEFWQVGEPNDVGGDEDFVHYARTTIDAAEGLYLPTWNDVDRLFDLPGFVVEARSLTTDLNDLVDGSEAGDLIDGGGGDDALNGLAGDDFIRGNDGADRIDGGSGDDTLSGGNGDDIFIMAREGGRDEITDFTQGIDRIDVSRLNLTSLSEIRVADGADGLELHAKGTTLVLIGRSLADTSLTADDFAGVMLHAGATLGTAEDRALQVGDVIDADELAGLRFRADDDATGDAGTFGWEVLDTWAEPAGLDILPDDADGRTAGSLDISLTAENDAPRGADRAYLVSEGSVLDARDAEIRLQATDPEGDAITFAVEDGPQHGTLDLASDGSFTYRPDENFTGDPDVSSDDFFTYRVSDGLDSRVYRVDLDIADTSAARVAEDTTPDDDGFRRLGGLTSDDYLQGHDGQDFIKAGWGRDLIEGKDGDDKVDGGAGDDTIMPGGGVDEITTGTGADLVTGTPEDLNLDRVTDFSEGDLLRLKGVTLSAEDAEITQGSAILDFDTDGDGTKDTQITLDGDYSDKTFVLMSDGADTMVMLAETGAVRLSPAGERFISNDPAANRVFGDEGDDFILAGAGSDVLGGAGGADVLIGDLGDDTLTGGSGNDEMSGGAGADTFTFDISDYNGFGVDTITDFTPGEDRIILAGFGETSVTSLLDVVAINTGTGGFIRLEGISLEDLREGDIITGPSANFALLNVSDTHVLTDAADRYITTDAASNTVLAQGGNDFLISSDGADDLRGEAGSDVLLGGNGNDTLDGGTGNDILTGGADADLFVFRAGETGFVTDTITDLDLTEDQISLIGYQDAPEILTLQGNATLRLSATEFVILEGITEEALALAAETIFDLT